MSESLKNQGNNPFRIFNLRALPDGHVKVMKDDIHSQNQKHKDLQEIAADEEGGDYYSLECSFAYHAAHSGMVEHTQKPKICTCSWYSILESRTFSEVSSFLYYMIPD